MESDLTKRQKEVLEKLYKEGEEIEVQTVEEDQGKISEDFGITRQALSNHLRELKEEDFIRTGRSFLDITKKGMELLGSQGNEAVITVQVDPNMRNEVYEKIERLTNNASRVTGNIDLVIKVGKSDLEDLLTKISDINGVIETKTNIILKKL